MNFFKAFLATLTILAGVTFTGATVGAQEIRSSLNCGGDKISLSKGCTKPDAEDGSGQVEELIKTIINVISALVGAIAVIMVLIGGFKFVTAGGDSNAVSSAKNTIIYAIVGLIIVAFAQVIVRFVLQRI